MHTEQNFQVECIPNFCQIPYRNEINSNCADKNDFFKTIKNEMNFELTSEALKKFSIKTHAELFPKNFDSTIT